MAEGKKIFITIFGFSVTGTWAWRFFEIGTILGIGGITAVNKGGEKQGSSRQDDPRIQQQQEDLRKQQDQLKQQQEQLKQQQDQIKQQQEQDRQQQQEQLRQQQDQIKQQQEQLRQQQDQIKQQQDSVGAPGDHDGLNTTEVVGYSVLATAAIMLAIGAYIWWRISEKRRKEKEERRSRRY